MGRWHFRVILTAGWLMVGVPLAVLFQKNIENLGERAGLNDLFGSGFDQLSHLGFRWWLVLSFVALTGAMIAVWGELAVRRLQQRRAIHNCADICFSFDENGRALPYSQKGGIEFAIAIDGQLHGKIHVSEPKASRYVCTLIVVFAKPLNNPVAHVSADRDVIWRDVSGSDKYIVLEIDPRAKAAASVHVIVRPEKWANWGRWIPAPMQWQDALKVPTELVNGAVVPPRLRDWLFHKPR